MTDDMDARARVKRLEAECERMRGKVREISEACQMDADRYRDDPNAWRACVSLDGYAADLDSLATPPTGGEPGQEAHPLRLDRVQTCEFHGRDFGACAQHSGQIPCEPEGGDAPHTPEQAHGYASAALNRIALIVYDEESPEPTFVGDIADEDFDIVRRHLTASGVLYVPEEVRRLMDSWRRRISNLRRGAKSASDYELARSSEIHLEELEAALASAPSDGWK